MGGFHDFAKKLELYKELGGTKHWTRITMRQIEQYQHDLCTSPWHVLKKEYPRTNETFLAESCFYSTFILEVLGKGLGFDERHDHHKLVFANRVGNYPLGWASGLM